MSASEQNRFGDAVSFPAASDRGRQAEAVGFSDARMEASYSYWLGKTAGRPMPSRGDIDPTEIPRLLRDIMLVDVLPDGRYRYRLIGTANTQAHGVSATGCYLDEILPGEEYKAHVLQLYDECVQERRPLYSECLFLSPDGAPARHTKVLFMPLSEDSESVNMVFVMQVFFYIDPATRERHFLDAPPYREIAHFLL